jgi:hypothetical protein
MPFRVLCVAAIILGDPASYDICINFISCLFVGALVGDHPEICFLKSIFEFEISCKYHNFLIRNLKNDLILILKCRD